MLVDRVVHQGSQIYGHTWGASLQNLAPSFIQRKDHHQMERGEFSACLSPPGLESLGAIMLYNTEEIMLTRKMEMRAEMQQALEYQGRRSMNLQISDLNNHDYNQLHTGGFPSPTQPHSQLTPVKNMLEGTIVIKMQLTLQPMKLIRNLNSR